MTLKNANQFPEQLHTFTKARTPLRCLLALALAILIGFVAFSRPLRDFVEYWAVGHLFVNGRNCYSLAEVFLLERSLGWQEPIPLVPLNPPWVLPVLAPLGALESYTAAWLIWICFLIGALCLSSLLLLKSYAADVRLPEVSDSITTRSLFVFSFYPTLLALRFAQITPLILLGVAAFLWFEQNGRPMIAGSALSLAAFKPQLVYLIILAVLLTSIRRRSFSTVIGLTWPLVLLTGIAVVRHPAILGEYWELSSGPYMRVYPSAVGAIMRLPFGNRDTFLLQFVPTAVGLVWFVFHWREHKNDWDWTREVPILITASLLTTSWGWLFDQALLVVPVIALFSRYARLFGRVPPKVIWIYTALNVTLIFAAMMKSFPLAYIIAPTTVAFAMFLSAHRQPHEPNRLGTLPFFQDRE